MPTARDLVRLRKKYDEKDVAIIAVYSARSSVEAFRAHVKSEKIRHPAIHDRDDRIGRAFGITDAGRKFPVTPTFLIGRDGKVLFQKAAFRHWSKTRPDLEERIDALLAEKK